MEKKYNKGESVHMLELLEKQITTNDRNQLRSLLKGGNTEIAQLLYSHRKKPDMLVLQKDLRQIIYKLKNAQSGSLSQQSSTQQPMQPQKQPKMSKIQKHPQTTQPISEQKQNSIEDKKQKLLQIKKEQQKRELEQFQFRNQQQQDQIQQETKYLQFNPQIQTLKCEVNQKQKNCQNIQQRITEEKTDNEKYSEDEQKESLQEYTESQGQTDDIQVIEQTEIKKERHHYTIDYINQLLIKSQEAIRSSQLQFESISKKLGFIREQIEHSNLQQVDEVKKEEFFLSFNPNTNFKSEKLKQFLQKNASYDSEVVNEILNKVKINSFNVEEIFEDMFSGNSMSRISKSYFSMKIQCKDDFLDYNEFGIFLMNLEVKWNNQDFYNNLVEKLPDFKNGFMTMQQLVERFKISKYFEEQSFKLLNEFQFRLFKEIDLDKKEFITIWDIFVNKDKEITFQLLEQNLQDLFSKQI